MLRAFGATVNERLELSDILEAARTHLPSLLEYSVLVHVGRPELHVYPSEGTSAGVVHNISTIPSPPPEGAIPAELEPPSDRGLKKRRSKSIP